MADVTSEYAAANGWREIDISGERYRAYRYADGSAMRIDDPQRVFVKSSEGGDSHRVVDANGITIAPQKGWIAIEWYMPDGPHFVA